MARSQYDIVVVGAGPVGLALALGLARAGRAVLVLEKEAATSEHSRAPLIWPRTLEILAGLEVIDRFLEEGIVLSRIELWDADRDENLFRLPLEELQEKTAFPQLLICPQSQTESLLYAALEQETSAEILFSSEALDFDQQEEVVTVYYDRNGTTHSVTATFVAGCDGASSKIREVLGASFEGRTYQMRAALADVTLGQDRDLPFPRMTRRRGLATGLRIDHHLWRVIVPRTRQGAMPLDEHIERAIDDLFSTDAYTTVWQSEFDLHRRISSQFAQGRVVLAGDAAHLRSPVGGEGMNLGIQDAEALKRALLGALDQENLDPLTEYVRQRRAAVQGGMVRFTDWLTRNVLAGRATLVVPAFRIAGILLRFRLLRHMVMQQLAMLDDPSRESE